MTKTLKDSNSVATENGFSVQVFHSFAEVEPLRDAWNNMVLRSNGDIYGTFEWCRLWWQHYGEHRSLQLVLCFFKEELVGLVPAFIETLWLGSVGLRVAKLVGSDFTLHLCNLAILPENLTNVVSCAVQYFLGKKKCDLLLFGPLSGPAARINELHAAGETEGDCVGKAEIRGTSCNTYFHLPTSYEEYLQRIDKQPRGNLNRSIAQLSKGRRAVFDVVSDATEVDREFENFRVMHDRQWQTEGKLGHFNDWPHALEFNRDLIRTLGALGRVRFYRVLADDQIVSTQYSFVYNSTNYWRLPARVGGPEWDRLSFGRMGLAKMIDSSIHEGVRMVEGGRGHYGYKMQMGGREWPLRTVQFMRKGPLVSARVRIFKSSASLLNLVYYKVLFARLAPRISALRRPLWPVWIRSTF